MRKPFSHDLSVYWQTFLNLVCQVELNCEQTQEEGKEGLGDLVPEVESTDSVSAALGVLELAL